MKRAKRTMDELFVRETSSQDAESISAVHDTDIPLTNDKIKPRLSRFWKIYSAVFGSLCALVLLAILFCNWVLADYESARPSYVAQEVFESYFLNDDAGPLLEKSGFALTEFETSADFMERWNSMQTEELTLVRVSADNGGDVMRYNVRSGEKTLAAFELCKTEQMTHFQNPLYELSEIELGLTANKGVAVEVPFGSLVTLNGVAVSEKYITDAEIETASCKHMPQGVRGLYYTRYEINGLMFDAELKVQNSAGQELAVEQSAEEEGLLRATLLFDDELKAQMERYVIEAAQTFAASMQNDRPRTAALSYIDRTSDLYQQTATISLWVSEHSGYHFEKVKAEEFYRYDENTFSCRISFVHVLTGGTTKFDKNGENREFVDITWYFKKVGDKYLIYDRENN